MFFSKETQYTLQALTYMGVYGREGIPIHSGEIARRIGLPHQFMLRGLMTLVKAGILFSQRGKGGGFTFARPPADITLYDVASAVGEKLRFDECVLGYPECSSGIPCLFHDRVKGIVDTLIHGLKTTTLAQLIEEPMKLHAMERK